MKDGEVILKFKYLLSCTRPRPQEDLDTFKTMVEYQALLRDKLEDGDITESEYWLKEIKFPKNQVHNDISYSISLNLNEEDQLIVENINDSFEISKLVKDLFPDFSCAKMKKKPKKE